MIVPPVSSNTPPENCSGPFATIFVAVSLPPFNVNPVEIVAVASIVNPLLAPIMGEVP